MAINLSRASCLFQAWLATAVRLTPTALPGVSVAPDDQQNTLSWSFFLYLCISQSSDNGLIIHRSTGEEADSVRQTHLREVIWVNFNIFELQLCRLGDCVDEGHCVCGAKLLNPPETMTPELIGACLENNCAGHAGVRRQVFNEWRAHTHTKKTEKNYFLLEILQPLAGGGLHKKLITQIHLKGFKKENCWKKSKPCDLF